MKLSSKTADRPKKDISSKSGAFLQSFSLKCHRMGETHLQAVPQNLSWPAQPSCERVLMRILWDSLYVSP